MAPTAFTVLLSLLSIFAPSGQAQTGIKPGYFLTAGEGNCSWMSTSGDFAFGFQHVGNRAFLLAIWFDKIPEKTIVWSANRDNLAPRGSKVLLNHDGRLVLVDPNENEIWARGLVGASYASMLDNGNFVLQDKTGSNLWESFSEPSDTLLPLQVLNQGAKLVSRYSDINYSTGRFELRLRTDGYLGSYTPPIVDGNSYYWSIGAEGYQLIFNQTGLIHLNDRNGSVVGNVTDEKISSEKFYQRAILEYDGVFRQYVYPRNGSLVLGWIMNWSMISSPVPSNICTSMMQRAGSGVCGLNSYCSLDNNRRPKCGCPPGYSYINPSYEMDGCKPDFRPQSCEEGMPERDLFVMHDMVNTNWPLGDYASYQNQDEEFCRRACLDDCLCSIAQFAGGICWKKRMPFSNGMVDTSVDGKVLIKVPIYNKTFTDHPGRGRDEGKRQGTIIGLSVLLCSSVAFNLILLLLTILIWFRCFLVKKDRARQTCQASQFSGMHSFTYPQLRDATGGFKELLGRGAYGSVYKGVLHCNERNVIAVKVLDKVTSDGDNEFRREVDTIGRTNHRNLVELIGFCNEGRNRILVYEFMPNGSLAEFLFKKSRPSWFKRMEISHGVARGLLYLHEECSKQIIHCDIKPGNILLDESLTAKISDFGLAKHLMIDQTRTATGVRGTKGYVAPEWYRNMRISVKVDVYSFGIMLLELICCRKNCEFKMSGDSQMILSDWVYDCYHKGELELILEGDDEMFGDINRVQRFVMVAIWCIQEEPSLRPSMKKVTQMLEGAVEVSVPPGPSSFISSLQ